MTKYIFNDICKEDGVRRSLFVS